MMRFSAKQRRVLTWWRPDSPDAAFEAIICDGAVRSGKTLCMGLSFFLWASACYSGARFGLCGKTIASLRRNVVTELLPKLQAIGFSVRERRTENLLQVSYRGHTNEFYLFGGRDEGSAALIQGITFAGVLLDEVALMPRSFVEQACARCSVTGSRLWFNCNPEGPYHWFYTEWIGHAAERNCLYLHFTMEDNPALSPDIRSRYARLYSGVFYRRFVLGQWVAAEGRVYDFFEAAKAPPPPEGPFNQWYISCDYGTVNPASFGLWGRKDAVWYRVKEFYFDSRREQRQMTDAEYERALRELAGGRPIAAVIVDPSAAAYRLERPPGGQRRAQRHPPHVGSAQVRQARAVRHLHGLPARDRAVCLGPEGRARRRAQGARPRHGRHALFRLDGAGSAAPGPGRMYGYPEGVGVGAL